MAAQLSTSDVARLAVCRRRGHQYPVPWRDAKPGDQHWCDYCGTRRVMDGKRPVYYPADRDQQA